MEDNLVDEICPEIRKALFEVAESLLDTSSFKIHVDKGSKKGDNFVGIVYRITCSTEDESRTKSLFLKIAPTDPMKQKIIPVHKCFVRESYMYDVVLPYFKKFQEEDRNIYIDSFHEFPECYKTITTEFNECLFIEDLTQTNFKMIDRDAVTPEHILLVMKTMAKFHAVSFAIKNQEPEKFAEIVSNLDEVIFTRGENNEFANLMNQGEIFAMNCTDDEDVHLVKALLHLYQTNQYDLMTELVKTEPYSIVLHGDLWLNNIMFKYDETGKIVKNIRLIDFQLARYSNPVLDLVYFIFTCTTRELRGRNYNIYLKTYHDNLCDSILRLGSNPHKVYPFKEFQKQLQKFGKFGLLMASIALPVMTQEIDFNPDSKATQGNENKKSKQLSDSLKTRFRDIISDCQRLGYI